MSGDLRTMDWPCPTWCAIEADEQHEDFCNGRMYSAQVLDADYNPQMVYLQLVHRHLVGDFPSDFVERVYDAREAIGLFLDQFGPGEDGDLSRPHLIVTASEARQLAAILVNLADQITFRLPLAYGGP